MPSPIQHTTVQQRGSGSDYMHFWHTEGSLVAQNARGTLKRISRAPMFQPFGMNAWSGRFPTRTTGIVPIGAFLEGCRD